MISYSERPGVRGLRKKNKSAVVAKKFFIIPLIDRFRNYFSQKVFDY